MAHSNESATSPTHIPPFARSLAPYIKSRQDALRIRQALTSHLRSHITFADDNSDRPICHTQSHLSLCVPQDAVVDVKRVPSDLTGLRREYLEALQANVAARKEYQSKSDDLTSAKNQGKATITEVPAQDSNLELQTYLKLLRDRRRYAKLQVFQHYLQELKARDTDLSGYVDNREGRGQQLLQSEEFEEGRQSEHGTGDGIESLVHNLERAVIRAKTQLDREKKLLEELKTQHESHSNSITTPVKVVALQRSRDELVHWVEEKLVSAGNSDDSPLQELPAEEIEESTRLLEDQKAQIAEQYLAYVKARKRLLDAATGACQSIATGPTNPPNRSTDPVTIPVEQNSFLEPLEVLSFTSELLLPLSKTQRALALQKNYLSGILTKEKCTTLRILNRLRDESHLLPEYPFLARQPRFKHINTRHTTNATESTKPDEVVALAEAWAFASEAAGSNEREYVEQQVVHGKETVQDAQRLLQAVSNTLNQDLEETLRDGQDQDEDKNDIWTVEARSTKSRTRMTRIEKRPNGPWAALNGRVGVED